MVEGTCLLMSYLFFKTHLEQNMEYPHSSCVSYGLMANTYAKYLQKRVLFSTLHVTDEMSTSEMSRLETVGRAESGRKVMS